MIVAANTTIPGRDEVRLGQAPGLSWLGFGVRAAAGPGRQFAGQLLHPWAITLDEHVMEVVPDLLDVDVVPDEAFGQGGEQVIGTDRDCQFEPSSATAHTTSMPSETTARWRAWCRG